METTKTMMKDVLWNFEKEKFPSLEKFKEALIKYNETIKGEPSKINLEENVLNTKQVVIQYSCWDEQEEDEIEPSFLLEADNNSFFSAGELLFKVHNQVRDQLKDEDHKFFEGFDLWEGENPNYPDVPLYFLEQGS